jgi:hypothetical protein
MEAVGTRRGRAGLATANYKTQAGAEEIIRDELSKIEKKVTKSSLYSIWSSNVGISREKTKKAWLEISKCPRWRFTQHG